MKRTTLLLLMLTACPGREPQAVFGLQDDPNGGHPAEYRTQPGGGSLWQNLASGGAGYMLGRMHGKLKEDKPRMPSTYHPQAPMPPTWKNPPPAPRHGSEYSVPAAPVYRAPPPAHRQSYQRSAPSYSRPSSGGARGRYSR